MKYHVDYEKAMQMVNEQLREMKGGVDAVDDIPLKGEKKRLAKHMKRIYRKLKEMVSIYKKSHKTSDFTTICRELEALKPSFTLTYNEILYDQGLEKLTTSLGEMAEELDQVDAMPLSEIQEIKAREMHKIYDTLHKKVDAYAHSHDIQDFEAALLLIEQYKPTFVLNYHELID